LFFGCKSNEPSKTEVFMMYLADYHKRNIPNEINFFIIIPEYGCNGCFQVFIPNLITGLMPLKNHVTFIVSKNSYLSDTTFSTYENLRDSTRIIDYLPLEVANITVIQTKNYEIDKIIHLNSIEDANKFINDALNNPEIRR
jgi:hypothetical protein